MRIVICGSMSFAKEMIRAKERLKKRGHKCVIPPLTFEFANGRRKKDYGKEDIKAKKKIDAIRLYYNEIKKSEAVLVLNYKKREVPGYIGGNSLIEIAFAHVLGKKIFLLNPIPKMDYTSEIVFMAPTVLDGDLGKI